MVDVYQNLAILAAFVFYGIASKGLEKTPFSGAIVSTAFGLACGLPGLGILDSHVEGEGLTKNRGNVTADVYGWYWSMSLVPGEGIEPSWCCHRGILSPVRLPIPPSRLQLGIILHSPSANNTAITPPRM